MLEELRDDKWEEDTIRGCCLPFVVSIGIGFFMSVWLVFDVLLGG